jgi:hypothetical protein
MTDLIEPINVIIEQIDKSATPFPGGMTGRKFPVNHVVRNEPVTLPGQVVHGDRDQDGNFTQLGTDEERKGYVLFRYEDINKLNINLKRGDKIIKLGQLETELYFTHSTGDPAAHFTGIGGFTLVRMFFQDRDPVGPRST